MTTNPQADLQDLPLRSLKLRPGMSVQVLRESGTDGPREAQFLAAIDSRGVMVGPHGSQGTPLDLKPGESYVIRGFTGQYDFAFSSKALQNFDEPFVYALLAYPACVHARLVRKALRMRTSVPARATGTGASTAQEVTIIDLSTGGALLRAPAALGGVNSPVGLSFNVAVDETPMGVTLAAAICHSAPAEGGGFNVGVVFRNVSANDKLVLHYLSQPQ